MSTSVRDSVAARAQARGNARVALGESIGGRQLRDSKSIPKNLMNIGVHSMRLAQQVTSFSNHVAQCQTGEDAHFQVVELELAMLESSSLFSLPFN